MFPSQGDQGTRIRATRRDADRDSGSVEPMRRNLVAYTTLYRACFHPLPEQNICDWTLPAVPESYSD